MNWWIVIVVVIALLVFIKYKELRHKVGPIAVILLLLFLAGTFGQIYLSNDLDLTSFDGMVHAGKVYFTWLGTFFGNVMKIGGYAVKQDWDSENNMTIFKSNTKTKVK